MQKTESLYPLIVCRSDGQLEHITRTGIKELNQPTTAQQNDTPDANGNVDCYRRLEDASEKGLDWRRKLGGMFKEAIMMDSKEHSKKRYVLKELPEGYTLWEHVKYNKKKMDTEDKKKEKGRHAAGIYERQDAYLYGHPLGRKKRFRSPVEFFPHLLWLAVDKEGDPANCSCKICCPEKDEVQTPEDAVKEIPKPEPVEIKPPVKKEPKPAPSSNSRSVPSSSTAPPPPPAAPIRATATPSKPSTARPTNGRSPEATADGDPDSKYFYRPGELVWFNNGLNWRLGVIGRRGLLNEHPRYLIQPLSNPLQHQPPQIKTDQKTSLRPWLAWSAPLPTISQINNISFDKIPWERVITGEFNDGRKPDYVVDGSILAAKMIDASYSLFDRNDHALAGPGEVHYNGMFFGAEKIWVGEPVRLRVKVKAVPDIVVMVVQKLIERTVQGRSSVTFVGDVYKLVQMPSPYTNRSQWPTPDLPARMVADLRYRNEVADDAHANIWSEWRLLEPAARKELADIRGRWYEARTLLPILRGAEKYEEDKRSGKILDVGLFMNGRLDNNGVPEQRRKNRRDTVGASVPAGFKFSRGLDGLPAENVFPDEQQLQAPLQLDDANDLDQFMDLDGAGQNFYV